MVLDREDAYRQVLGNFLVRESLENQARYIILPGSDHFFALLWIVAAGFNVLTFRLCKYIQCHVIELTLAGNVRKDNNVEKGIITGLNANFSSWI